MTKFKRGAILAVCYLRHGSLYFPEREVWTLGRVFRATREGKVTHVLFGQVPHEFPYDVCVQPGRDAIDRTPEHTLDEYYPIKGRRPNLTHTLDYQRIKGLYALSRAPELVGRVLARQEYATRADLQEAILGVYAEYGVAAVPASMTAA